MPREYLILGCSNVSPRDLNKRKKLLFSSLGVVDSIVFAGPGKGGLLPPPPPTHPTPTRQVSAARRLDSPTTHRVSLRQATSTCARLFLDCKTVRVTISLRNEDACRFLSDLSQAIKCLLRRLREKPCSQRLAHREYPRFW